MSRTPHDKLFKRIFRDPRYAAEELRTQLPSSLVAALDWSSLQRESESHVDESLADIYSDLVFSARAGSERVLVYVLFEHQSTNDERMALRLLEYMVKIWTHFVEDEENSNEPLPLIIPVVLAHAQGGWTSKRRFTELFTRESLALAPRSIPDFEYVVDDLAKSSHQQLKTRALSDPVKLTLWVLRDARNGSTFLAAAGEWVAALERTARDPQLRHVATALVNYLWFVLDEEIMDDFRVMLANEAPMAEGLTTTAGERLLAQGHERGRAEGKLEGKIEGKLESEAKLLLLVLEARGLPLSESERARIDACGDLETLTRWVVAAATADSAAAALT